MELQRFLHRMNQRAESSQIFGQALPCRARRQAEDPAASNAACQPRAGRLLSDKGAAAGLAREVAQIQKGRLQSDFLASAGERSCEHLGALSYASVCY